MIEASPTSPAPARGAPFRAALVIANPIAGRGDAGDRAGELAQGMRALGIETELFFTSARGDAPKRLAELDAEVDLVVAAGGDGTLREVLSALPERVTVGVLPMGTANVLGVELGIPRGVRGALRTIAGGTTQGLDVADVNGRLCFLVTGVGVDGWVVRDVERGRRGPINKLTYVGALLRTLRRYRSPRLSVEVDGEAVVGEYAWVLVSNVLGYGGVLRLSRRRVLDDGLFEVFLFPEGSTLALIRYGLRGVLRHLPGGSCRMVQARRVRVTSPDPVPYEIDGDYGGETPVVLEVTGARYRILVPSSGAAPRAASRAASAETTAESIA